MFSHNGKVSGRQMMILLILQMFNMNLLIIPRICTQYLGRNGYIAPIIAIIIGVIYLFIITGLTLRFPDFTFAEISKHLLPNSIAYILILLLCVKFIISTGLEVRMFTEVIAQVMLPKTPKSVIMIVLLLTVAYLVKSGVEAIARMGEVIIYFVIVPLIIVLLMIIFRVEYKEIMPFFQISPREVLAGTGLTSFIFIPLEVLLVFNGLMNKPEEIKKVGVKAIITIGIIEGIITLLCITQCGVKEIKNQIWPVIVLMKSIGLNNSVQENQEMLMLIVWIFSIFMNVSISILSISLLGSRSCNFKRENVFVLPVLPIILLIALLPHDLGRVYTYYLNFQYYYGIWFVMPIPLILLLIAKIKHNIEFK